MARTLQALRVCSQKLRQYRVKKMRLVATEACRRAANGPELMRQIRKETGLKLEIIKAEEEAQLAVLSCAPLVSSPMIAPIKWSISKSSGQVAR
jgi:exopolyphosphatase/guanosine-5'-triphosphate,3'-diphosphate pyrophosphatase